MFGRLKKRDFMDLPITSYGELSDYGLLKAKNLPEIQKTKLDKYNGP